MKTWAQSIAQQLSDLYTEQEAGELAWWILEESTGLTRAQLQFGGKVTTNIPNLQEIITRLRSFEPIQYIFERTSWCGLDLKVSPATLIPRPETAELVERVCSDFRDKARLPLRALDACTGSGCIALALKQRFPDWRVDALDVSEAALRIAKENAVRNGLNVNFFCCDILSAQASNMGQYDILVSNPPYVCHSEKAKMSENVLKYEPHTALFVPDEDPLLFYRSLARLHVAPQLYFEINEAYADAACSVLGMCGYPLSCVYRDMYGKSRILSAGTAVES